MKRLYVFILISVATHLLLKAGLFSLADYFGHPDYTDRSTEVELVETRPETDSYQKPIIKQLEPANPVDNDNSQARFDSEKTQRVQKETKARELGLTQNATTKKNNQPQKEKNSRDEVGDLPEFTRMNSPNSNSSQQSLISTDLPSDIQTSDATNLNTDANTYYSFYSRVEELFYVRWVERLNSYWERLAFEFKKNQLAGRNWQTAVEIWLKANGEFHSAYVMQSSGYKPFDEAAVFAFKNARFFPNPPKAKVESDGFVRLRYRFNVRIGPIY